MSLEGKKESEERGRDVLRVELNRLRVMGPNLEKE